VALGTPCHLLVPRAVLKETPSHLGEFTVRTTAKPRIVCKSYLPEIQQVQQCSSGCIPYHVPRVLLLCDSSVGSAQGRDMQYPCALTVMGYWELSEGAAHLQPGSACYELPVTHLRSSSSEGTAHP